MSYVHCQPLVLYRPDRPDCLGANQERGRRDGPISLLRPLHRHMHVRLQVGQRMRASLELRCTRDDDRDIRPIGLGEYEARRGDVDAAHDADEWALISALPTASLIVTAISRSAISVGVRGPADSDLPRQECSIVLLVGLNLYVVIEVLGQVRKRLRLVANDGRLIIH